MPTYDYRCGACGSTIELFHSISEAPKRKCPNCGKPKLERQISAGAGILFKGSGFYQTDYRSDAYKSAASADAGSAPTETKPSSDSDAKPGAQSKTDSPASKPAAEKKSSKPKKSE